jgi:hypothetical protein
MTIVTIRNSDVLKWFEATKFPDVYTITITTAAKYAIGPFIDRHPLNRPKEHWNIGSIYHFPYLS